MASLSKRHLSDPSLAASLLGADAERLMKDPNTLGLLFESLATRDMRVYAQALDAHVFHYRDRNGDLEVDMIVEKPDGSWVGVEVKLGSYAIDDAATSLRTLAQGRVARAPQALVVVTATEYAYRREDGVDVAPLGAMMP